MADPTPPSDAGIHPIVKGENWLFNIASRKASTDGGKAVIAYVISFLARPDVAHTLSAAGVTITINPEPAQIAMGGVIAFAIGWLHDYLKFRNIVKF